VTGGIGGNGPTARLATGGEPAISTRRLSKRYGAVTALEGLDLDVPAGTIFGLLGPNGAGKTTAIRLLTGLARPTAGTATVAGIPIGSAGDALHRRIGYLDQDPRFYAWMSGRELLRFVGGLHGLAGPDLRARVDEMLAVVGLTDAAGRAIGGYSGGMRQRLGIGQALLARPAVLFLDEPVSSVDPEGRRDILEIVERMRGATTVFLSTHILADVERVCDRVAILDFGRLVVEAAIGELLERYAQPIYTIEPEPGQAGALDRLADALSGQPWLREIRREHGLLRVVVSDAGEAGRSLLPILAATGVPLVRFERARPSLEEVFLYLVAARPAHDAGTTTDGAPPLAPGLSR
jgi:ABC-2 type transport system ATP-binding protein